MYQKGEITCGLPGLNTYSKVEINYHLRRVAVSESFRVPQ